MLGASLSLVANQCSAAIYNGNLVTFSYDTVGGAPGFSGGEFKVTYDSQGPGSLASGGEYHDNAGVGTPGENFLTFCLERNEFIDVGTGTKYEVYPIGTVGNNKAFLGGIDAAAYSFNGDPLSNGTAWLYKSYRDSLSGPGGLKTIALGGGFQYQRTVDAAGNAWARAVQAVIWRLEGEVWLHAQQTGEPAHVDESGMTIANAGASSWWQYITGNSTAADDALHLYNYIASGSAVANYSNDYAGTEVVAFNILHHSTPTAAQSQLALGNNGHIGESNPEVPEPATMVAWGGFAAIGMLVSRLRRKS